MPREAETIARKTILLLCCSLALGGTLTGCTATGADTADVAAPGLQPGGTVADSGMVSSGHPLATAAGVEILAAGGNAFDAAVAIAGMLTVVEPTSSNLFGGYGTLIVYDAAAGAVRYLDNNGRFPGAVDSDVFREAEDFAAVMRSAKAVSTPGNLHGFELLWQEYGSRPWGELLEPATGHAAEGFEISERLAGAIAQAWPLFSEYTRSFYGHDDRPLAAGERLIQSDLAESFRLAAAGGAASVHGGSLGAALAAEIERRGGFLSLADLEAHRSEWLEPVAIDYRGYEVVTAGPPSNSFASLVCLGVMSRYDVAAMEPGGVEYLHTFAEATKHAFWARLRYAGGPEENPPPLGQLLSEAHWERQAQGIDPASASTFVPPALDGAESESTTHFVVADRAGNVVSATLTLGHGFGSAVMAEGTGIWLNNSLAYSTFEPKGNPMDALPGRRKHSSKTPTLILRDGGPWVAIGTPGGHTIPQTVPQMVIQLIDFGAELQQALDAPRIAFAEPDRLLVGDGFAPEVLAELEARGHRLQGRRGIGIAHALEIEYGEEGPLRFVGAADRRGEGMAQGVDRARP